jgi:hypothetical protein
MLKLASLSKKIKLKNKAVIVIMKEEDEEGEKAEKVGKNWADGEVHYLITLQGKMQFVFTKNTKKQGKFQFIETLEIILDLIFALFSKLKLGCNDRIFESKVGKKKKSNWTF